MRYIIYLMLVYVSIHLLSRDFALLATRETFFRTIAESVNMGVDHAPSRMLAEDGYTKVLKGIASH